MLGDIGPVPLRLDDDKVIESTPVPLDVAVELLALERPFLEDSMLLMMPDIVAPLLEDEVWISDEVEELDKELAADPATGSVPVPGLGLSWTVPFDDV